MACTSLVLILCFSLPASPFDSSQAGAARLPAGFDPLIRTYSPAAEKALKALRQGVEAFLLGRYADALKSLPDEDAAASTAVGDYALFYRAKASLAVDRAEESLQLFRRLQMRFPVSALIQESILGEAGALLKLNQPSAALALWETKKIEEGPESSFGRARALEQAGKATDAQALYLRVYAKYTTSKAASLAEQRLLSLAPSFKANPKNYSTMLERADNLLRAGKNRDARSLLLRLASVKTPGSAAGDRRKVLWAQAEFNLGRHAALNPVLEKIGSADAATHAQSVYLRALCYRKQGREDSLLAMRDLALRLHPQSPFTEKLLFSVAAHFDQANRLPEAGDTFSLIASRFPRGEYGERALWRSALFLYFQKRFEEALRAFWNYQMTYPERAPLGTVYWLGRCYEKMGDGARAGYLYGRCRVLAGDGYYGQRARQSDDSLRKSGAIPGTAAAAIDFPQVRKWVDGIRAPEIALSEPSPAAAAVLERARQLISAEMPDAALSELRLALRRTPEDLGIPYVMSRIYERKVDYFGVIRTLRRAFPDYDARPLASLPPEVWEMLFPMKYDRAISAESARHGVDPNLVRAVIRQESAFDEDARSPANARGLMQVLPSTGRILAREAGMNKYTVQKLYQADVNIALGTRYLASLLRGFDRKIEVALVAYNAGSDRAERWTQDFGTSDMAEFVDRIPFTETRDYVKQVLTNRAYYRLLTATMHAETR